MFFARIWSLILICYINQGILVIKFGCQIPRNDLQKDSPAPIARFYISITANSFLIWMELDLSFSHPLSRDVIFLAVVGSLIDITIRVSPDHPSNFSKDKDNIKDKDITTRVSPDHPSNYFWPIGFLQLTAVKCFMLQQTSFDYSPPPMRKNTRRLSYFSFSDPVLTSVPRSGCILLLLRGRQLWQRPAVHSGPT